MTDDILGESFGSQFEPPKFALGSVVYAERDGKILLLKRAEGGAFAGQWYLPGGAVDPGETPDHAAVRELQEESGLECAGEPELIGAYFSRLYGHDFLMLSYRVAVAGDVVISHEHTESMWTDPLDMRAFMTDEALLTIARGDQRIASGLKLLRDDLDRYIRRIGRG